MLEFLPIIHVLGVVFGAGGAFASDLMFFSTVRDKKISKTELRFMRLGSTMVWVGLGILALSGLAMFLTAPDVYAASSKFQLKMTVVAVIVINGLVFHRFHIPRMKRHAGSHLPSSDEFMRNRHWLLISGGISSSSWLTAFLLGSLRSIPLTYSQGLLLYAVLLAIAITGALVMKSRLLPHHRFTNA